MKIDIKGGATVSKDVHWTNLAKLVFEIIKILLFIQKVVEQSRSFPQFFHGRAALDIEYL
jgi:hypothetical protein